MTYSSTESQSTPLDEIKYESFQEDEVKSFNWSMLILQAILFAVGIFNLISSTAIEDRALDLYKTQLLWFGLGLVATAIILLIHFSFLSRMAYFIYFINLVLLAVVLFIGNKTLGSSRWIHIGGFNIQPSEIMKISLVICLAKYFETDKTFNGYNFRQIIPPAVITIIPAFLIMLQPDLGTALILILTFLSMIIFMKVRKKTLVSLILIAAFTAPLAYQFALKPYQQKRILTFLDPMSDPKGAGYNSIQSMIAVGSGKLTGKGYRQGTQSHLNFLPEHHTDFVFSVFSEEHGFVGCVLLFLLFMAFLVNGLSISQQANDKFAMLLSLGVTIIFFWHIMINLAMVMGLLPVVGVPLPYLSYGGSSLVTSMIGVAILVNIANRKYMF